MTALAGDDVNTDLGRAVQALFEAVGEVAVVSEADLDRLGALSGAGPGYMFVILDALADAGRSYWFTTSASHKGSCSNNVRCR